MNIMFVCTGNTCRSPMAEAMYNNLISKSGKTGTAISRGISVFEPEPLNPKASCALQARGIMPEKHNSTPITTDDIESVDIVLTMTTQHKMLLKALYPKYASKIYTLAEKAFGKDLSIKDPFGGSQQVYDECADQILYAVERIIENE